jgi:uncharacterized ferritin-like protein (DUF455 family)
VIALSNIFEAVRAALVEADPRKKCALAAALEPSPAEFGRPAIHAAELAGIPGRPERPELVHPRDVVHRGLGTAAGRAAMVHAVAHIEFNAINLALDAALRFRELPCDFVRDWISVAQDEARHFGLLGARLEELGYHYGDFCAHNGLWEAAEKTSHDVLARMALVPRVLEARGLDVTPGIIHRFVEIGDAGTVSVLRIILDEEVRHVAIGTHWFRWLCAKRGLEPNATFKRLLAEHGMRVRLPLNRAARAAAGFDDEELDGVVSP